MLYGYLQLEPVQDEFDDSVIGHPGLAPDFSAAIPGTYSHCNRDLPDVLSGRVG